MPTSLRTHSSKSVQRKFPHCSGVEAPLKSGSMITVDFALKQGRDVFAVMGNVDSPYSKGANQLIKEGAVPVTNWQDVAEFYRGLFDEETEN